MHACSRCALIAQGHTSGSKVAVILKLATQHSVYDCLLVNAEVESATTCPNISVCIIQVTCMNVVAVH